MIAGQCHQLLLGGRWCSIRRRTFGAEFELDRVMQIVQFPAYGNGDKQEQRKAP